MSNDICGEETAAGEPCKRDAGWGREGVDDGPCVNHVDDFHNPDKLTEETKSTLVGAAQEGAFKEHCAQVAGITPRTLRKWLEWGEEDVENDVDSPCADLFFRYSRARGAGAVRRLKDVKSEFVLERSYGYTKTEQHEVSGPDGEPIEQETTHSADLDESDYEFLDQVFGDNS